MPPRRKPAHHRKTARTGRVVKLLLLTILVIAIVVGAVFACGKLFPDTPSTGDTTTTTSTPEPEGPKVVATATIGSSGDILIHNTVRKAFADAANGGYDFTDAFSFLSPYVSAIDYAVVNAEFSVSTGSTYSSLPFRVPTAVVKALKDCGYDMGLTANNHIADGGVAGIKKTMDTLKEYGMDFTGSRYNSGDSRYVIKDINGIKIGFLNYTYGSYWNTNSFSNNNLNALYTDAESLIQSMRTDGAELIYLYIHWGAEYALSPNENQQAIAQKMCDLGVDVIVGGHPHKIQPLEMITSTSGDHQTICLYSSGNLLSGQQIECMAGGTRANSPSCFQDSWHFAGCDYPDVADRTKDTHRLEHGTNCNDNGHTEDGVLFNVTATKYEDGTVMISAVDVLPVWCMGRGFIRAAYPTNSSFEDYILIPLDKSVNWGTAYELTEAEVTEAGYSYNRTMKLIGDGMTTINGTYGLKIAKYIDAYKEAQKSNKTNSTTAQ